MLIYVHMWVGNPRDAKTQRFLMPVMPVTPVAGWKKLRLLEVMEKYSHVDVGDGVHPGQLVWCQAPLPFVCTAVDSSFSLDYHMLLYYIMLYYFCFVILCHILLSYVNVILPFYITWCISLLFSCAIDFS